MAKAMDFNKNKKSFWTVTLPDEKKTVLLIGTPTKAVFDELVAVKDALGDDTESAEAINDLYEVSAKIMSRNKTGHVVTVEMLQSLFDFEDIVMFLHGYTEFVHEVAGSKN